MWNIYTMDYYLDKEWNLAICDNTDGPRGYYEKWNQSDREREYDFTDMWNLKNSTVYRHDWTETES